MKSIVIIPTYNESENIEQLIEDIFHLDRSFYIIVVDDNSPDGTGKILSKLAERYPQIKAIQQKKRLGLARAYIEGFKVAVQERADFIFQMDADFSHLPKYLPRMLEAIKDSDLVIGSRYIKAGGVKNWDFARHLLSRLANLYVRIVTGMPVFDSTSGFKCFRSCVLEEIDLDRVESEGYAFQIEMNYRVWKKGFRIKEAPIIFHERRLGKSKLSRRIIAEAIWRVWKLKFGGKIC